MRLNVSPSEFWKLTPYEYWLLYDEFCIINGIAEKESELIDMDEARELFNSPAAKPSKAKRVKDGN